MSTKFTIRAVFAAGVVALGSLAPLPVAAQGYDGGGGYGYDEPSYQPRYYKPRRNCYYKRVRVYDEYSGYYVYRRVRVCD